MNIKPALKVGISVVLGLLCLHRLAASKTKGTINSIELALLSRLAELMSRHGAEEFPN